MRILSFGKIKCDKKYYLWLICTFILTVICGIVLYKISNIGDFFKTYANYYVVCVFSFNTAKLLVSHFFKEICYAYAFFALAYFTKFKILSCIIVFFRTVIFVFYCAVMFCSLGFSGAMTALIVYIPCFALSAASCIFVAECCFAVNKRYVFAFPAVVALINCIALVVLHNVVFRLLIVIV